MPTMIDPLEHAARLYGHRVALIDGDRRISYAEFRARCLRLAAGLRELGVPPGARVAVLAANSHRYVEAFCGIPAYGMVVVPLNMRLAEPELAAILDNCRPRVLLTDRDPGSLSSYVEHVVSMPTEYESLLAGSTSAPSATQDEQALAALFYTGGTTGAPKGVVLTHRNLVSNAFHKIIACSLTGEDRFLAFAAMFHVAGVAPLLGLLWLGATIVTLPSFDAEACLDAIEQHAISVVMPVPTMLAALVAAHMRRPRNVSSLRMIGHAGSSIANALIESAHAAFPTVELAQFYGATETSSIVTCLRNEQALIGTPLLGSCGQPVLGVAVKVVRDDGKECEPGEAGEIVVRGANVTGGYWNNPDVSAEALVDGWYHTGDLGLMGDSGYLFVVDRKKDMIISGGENIYSIEVEDVLNRHSAVVETAVFGIPDPVWGEAVHAVVVVDEQHALEAEALARELRTHCRSFIAGYKVPKQIDIQTAPLPKSGPGKILKRALRDRFWTEGKS